MAVSRERAMQLMQESLSSLHRSGLLEREVVVHGNTVLLGTGSALDSLGFVTFMTNMEDRLNAETNQELFLILNDIHMFNANNPHLSADSLAQYIVRLTGGRDNHHG